MEIKGYIYRVFETQTISDKFAKREFVIKTNEKYPQLLTIQVINDKCALLDNIQVSEHVTAKINLRGREWINKLGEAKYFNTIEAWGVVYSTPDELPEQQIEQPQPKQTFQLKNEDLPF
jgi:hypothetical protein